MQIIGSLKKTGWLLLLLPILMHAKTTAQAPIDVCPVLTGTWQGTYHDSSHLYPDQDFPIRLNLTYDKDMGMLLGYTMLASDKNGAGYGKTRHYFFAKCVRSQLSAPYLVSPDKACGEAGLAVFIKNPRVLDLSLMGSNAMMNWNLKTHLEKVNTVPLREKVIAQVKKLASSPIANCH